MTRKKTRAARLAFLLIALGLLFSVEPALRYARAASLLLAVIGADDPTGITHLLRHEVVEQQTTLALPHRALRARIYTPRDRDGRDATRSHAMVLHGVHPDAIDEPRLQAFAKALAGIGVQTYTPELTELAEQRVLPSTIDDIGACAQAIAALTRKKPGALGISFAGGLLLLAATAEPGASSLGYIVTVGAHHDLRRVLRYYAHAKVSGPDGEPALVRAHPYGAKVMVTAHAELYFALEDTDAGRSALSAWLDGRYKEARALASTLSASGRDRFDVAIDAGRQAELDARLLELAYAKDAELLAISPARGLGAVRVPTFLVHGEGDPIVPSLETAWLAREVPKEALRAALITPVLRHAEASGPPTLRDQLALVRFVAGFLAQAKR